MKRDVWTEYGAPSLQIFDNGQADGTDGFTVLTVLQSQAACVDVSLCPFQACHRYACCRSCEATAEVVQPAEISSRCRVRFRSGRFGIGAYLLPGSLLLYFC
jgi:hypothetical protein